jgi:eukaryotic-like serine/threonine-protein kinase
VTASGEVKLLDFGIAKLLESDAERQPLTRLTREGDFPLTPAYAAPEQVTGGPIGAATDVYALGVILFELLSGNIPRPPTCGWPQSSSRRGRFRECRTAVA